MVIGSVDKVRNGALPHPYVIQPMSDERHSYGEGDSFHFRLLLFGQVNKRLPHFIYAFDQMGRIGIGKKIQGRRASFGLETVEAVGQEIYNAGDQKLANSKPYTDLTLSASPLTPETRDKVSLNFVTPLRMKHNNRLAPELPFQVLVRAMLRRIAALLQHYDGGEPDLDYSGLVRRAAEIQTVATTLAWEDWRRYSMRQDREMMMGGLRGRVTYAGDLDEFMPLIDFCSHVHLGKQTTFGLGQFSVEVSQ